MAATGAAVAGLAALGDERDRHLAESLIAASDEMVLTDGSRAQLLAAAAWRLDPSDEAWTAMARSIDSAATGMADIGHDAAVTDIAFSPDGAAFATGAEDGTIALWDTDTWQPTRLDRRMSTWVEDIEFSPDGRFLAVGGYGKELLIWNLDTGGVAAPPAANSTELLAFAPDAARIATSGEDGTVTVWSLPTMGKLALFDTGAAIGGLAFDQTGERVLVGESDGEGLLRGFDAATGELEMEKQPNPDSSYTEVLSRKGFDSADLLFCGMWECQTLQDAGADSWTPVLLPGAVAPAAYTFRGDLIVAANSAGGLGVWESATGALVKALPYAEAIADVAVSPDGRTVVAAFAGGVQRWDLDRAERIDRLPTHGGTRGVVFTSDGSRLVATSLNGTEVWGAHESGPATAEYPDRTGLSIAASPEGAVVATGLEAPEASIELWDAATGESLRTFADPTGPATSLAFNHDGSLLASGSAGLLFGAHSDEYAVIIWDTATGREVLRLDWDARLAVYSLDFSADGTMLATVDQNGTVQVWDAATGELLAMPTGSGSVPSQVEFGPNGDYLFAATDDGVAAWPVYDLAGPPAVIDNGYNAASVAAAPKGTYLAVYEDYPDSTEGQVPSRLTVWDMERGGIVAALPAQLSLLYSIAVSPDERTIVVTDSASITRYDLDHLAGDLHRQTCEQAGRALTEREWEIYLPERPFGSIDIC